MAAIPIIGAVTGIIGAGLGLYGTIRNNIIQNKQIDLQEQEIKLNTNAQLAQYGIDIMEAESQIDSYDKWLANYRDQYKQETDSKIWSGRETYENFINAIGYSDALAGATGRIGAGTSSSEVTKSFDQKLVDYVGEDRTLNNNGGVFGQELSQLQLDLDFQRQEMEANRGIMYQSIDNWKNARNDLEKFLNDNFK